MSSDALGLTDNELDFLNTNKAYIEELQRQQDEARKAELEAEKDLNQTRLDDAKKTADEIKKSINQNKEYDKLLAILFKDTVICYNPTNDQLTHHSYKMVGNNPNIDLNKKLKFTLINRKSANNLSKIIKSVNPNSKYSNPNNMDIETY
jgi:hypothetical protein